MVHIQIQRQARPCLLFSRCELRHVLQVLGHLFGWRIGDIEVLITSDQGIAKINREFLHLPGPTNVLSFPQDMDPEQGLNGSIVLSIHALEREARLYGQEVREHGLRLLTHSVLHLAGFEHGELMEAMTDSGLEAALGLYAHRQEGNP